MEQIFDCGGLPSPVGATGDGKDRREMMFAEGRPIRRGVFSS